jgi:hypothetical protein
MAGDKEIMTRSTRRFLRRPSSGPFGNAACLDGQSGVCSHLTVGALTGTGQDPNSWSQKFVLTTSTPTTSGDNSRLGTARSGAGTTLDMIQRTFRGCRLIHYGSRYGSRQN